MDVTDSPTSTLSDAHALDDDEWHQYVIKNTDMLLPVNVPSSLDERLRALLDFHDAELVRYALSKVPRQTEWEPVDNVHTFTVLSFETKPVLVFVTGVLRSASTYVGPNGTTPSLRIAIEMLRGVDCDAVCAVERTAYGAGVSLAEMPVPLDRTVYRVASEGGSRGIQTLHSVYDATLGYAPHPDMDLIPASALRSGDLVTAECYITRSEGHGTISVSHRLQAISLLHSSFPRTSMSP